MKTIITICLLSVLTAVSVQGQTGTGAKEARRLFDKVYAKVFGPQGATMHYNVNIASLYKTEGTIWYKGKKSKFVSKNGNGWNDGKAAYVVREKKRTVEVQDASSGEKGKYEDDFKFEPDKYTYDMQRSNEGTWLTLKVKKGEKGMKEVKVLLDRTTGDPTQVRIKVGIVWATIGITKFRSGNMADELFEFPRAKYKDYKFIDKRTGKK